MEYTTQLPEEDDLLYIGANGIFRRLTTLPRTERTLLLNRNPELYFDAGEDLGYKFKDYPEDFSIDLDFANEILDENFADLESLKAGINGFLIIIE